MFFKSSAAIAALAVALTTLSGNIPRVGASAQPGAVALRQWALDILPHIIPNTPDGWKEAFTDGTWAPDAEFTWNNQTTAVGLQGIYDNLNFINGIITSRNEYYRFSPIGGSAFIFDPEGHTGLVAIYGHTSLKTKTGIVYEDGTLAGFGKIGWNATLQKRTILNWREVNDPPNYPTLGTRLTLSS